MLGDVQRSQRNAYSDALIGLIALGSWIPLPVGNVPSTLQTHFVLLASIVMHRYDPVLVYSMFGVLGLPLFHNGMAGIGVLLGPSRGYLIGFIIAALIAGCASEHDSRIIRIGEIMLATAAIYLFGTAWLMYSLHLGLLPAVMVGIIPFIPGDVIKAAAAYLRGQRLL